MIIPSVTSCQLITLATGSKVNTDVAGVMTTKSQNKSTSLAGWKAALVTLVRAVGSLERVMWKGSIQGRGVIWWKSDGRVTVHLLSQAEGLLFRVWVTAQTSTGSHKTNKNKGQKPNIY